MKALDLKKIQGGISPHPARQADEPTTPGRVGDGAGEGAQQGVPASEREPWGVAQVVTPSGLEIYYQAGPKRLYRVKPSGKWEAPDGSWFPEEWEEVPSVSSVTGCLFKPLENWGMKVGVQGILELLDRGVVFPDELGQLFPSSDPAHPIRLDRDGLVALMKEHKLTVYYETKRAQERGTGVHKALETWAETGVTPDPKFYPEHERGYVEGLVAFINDAHPNPIYSELMVASTEGYAGRFDLFANLDFAGLVVTRLYPKKAPKREAVSGNWLIDAKTSSGVWDSYKIQVAGYEAALIECGYPAPDHKGVLRLTEDGKYELVETHATRDDFLNVLATYRTLQELK